MSIDIVHEGPVSSVILSRPPLNLLNIEVMDALTEAHQALDARPETRVIITRSGVAGMFSNGLDPAYVVAMDEAERPAIFEAVGRMLHGLVHLGKPHLAVVNGPAMAGGAILAIAADFRIFDAEHGRISFAEPKVGLPIPRAVAEVISLHCAKPMLREVVMLAKNMDAKSAHEAGLADAVCEGDAALTEVVAKYAGRLARLSPAVLRETKAGLRGHLKPLTEAMLQREPAFSEYVGDDFLGEGLRAILENRFPNFPR